MFNKFTLVVIVIAAASFARAEGAYLGAGVNYINISDAKDAGFSVEALGGMALAKTLRGELAISFDRADFRSSTVKMFDVFANLYYDFKPGNKINPYVLGGIGFGSASTGNIFGSSSRDSNFLGQLGAGIAVTLSEQVMLDLKYRYQVSEDYRLPSTGSFKLNGHSLGLGFRYLF